MTNDPASNDDDSYEGVGFDLIERVIAKLLQLDLPNSAKAEIISRTLYQTLIQLRDEDRKQKYGGVN